MKRYSLLLTAALLLSVVPNVAADSLCCCVHYEIGWRACEQQGGTYPCNQIEYPYGITILDRHFCQSWEGTNKCNTLLGLHACVSGPPLCESCGLICSNGRESITDLRG